MRILYVRVPEDRRNEVLTALADIDVEYAVLGTGTLADVPEGAEPVAGASEGDVLLQIPVPGDAVGPLLDALEDAGVDTGQYTVVSSGETAMTSTWETLERRYSPDFDPLTPGELRSKAMDLSQDDVSYYALMVLSSMIATAGLLVDSPAIIVGSMVIAPVVGPVLTTSVGVITGERQMIVDSVRMQALGLAVAVLASTALGAGLQAFRFAPPVLDLSTIELVGVRLAPNMLAVIVGLAAGAAGGVALTTKGPMSLIGVMIAAALIPTAAASGLGIVWNRPLVWAGTLALLFVTVVAINVACFLALWVLYRPDLTGRGSVLEFQTLREAALLAAAIAVLAVVVVGAAGASAQQIAFERDANAAVHQIVDEPDHRELTVVGVRSQYVSPSLIAEPQTVTVVLSDTDPDDAPPPDLADQIAAEIERRTGRAVAVRVRTVEFQQSTP